MLPNAPPQPDPDSSDWTLRAASPELRAPPNPVLGTHHPTPPWSVDGSSLTFEPGLNGNDASTALSIRGSPGTERLPQSHTGKLIQGGEVICLQAYSGRLSLL